MGKPKQQHNNMSTAGLGTVTSAEPTTITSDDTEGSFRLYLNQDDKSAFEATQKHIGQDFLNTLKTPGDKKERLDRISELMEKTIEALGEDHEPSKI